MFFVFYYFPAELKMDVLREREVKDSLERQLVDERKLRGESRKLYRNYIVYCRICILNIFNLRNIQV